MTNVEGNRTLMNKWLSSDRVVFVIVSATIIGLIFETGIIRVSGFVGVHDIRPESTIFIGLGLLCIFSQLVILNYVRNKVGKVFFFVRACILVL